MAVEVLVTRIYRCDRCPSNDEFVSEAASDARGWTSVPSGVHVYVLCPTCAEKHRRFLQGWKTGAATQFNAGEEERWQRSCR